ncbi:hypothetical protein KZJ38_07350 [Paraburkholderia edwinii]|uniref:Uncharacterized protein n=1 Tax=Paraburkholderia edwinii TaxID=2861782 RepID=A0ABX8UMA1_9BURK|nr:hypothetical protein [Paraburkholderia edwinii]QYD70116.1 hypothetical protein KZJ38_07350 [Paraburkholderia edwinii]
MTKKHFEALAREIAKIHDANARREAAIAVARVCHEFNPTFNIARFYAACQSF